MCFQVELAGQSSRAQKSAPLLCSPRCSLSLSGKLSVAQAGRRSKRGTDGCLSVSAAAAAAAARCSGGLADLYLVVGVVDCKSRNEAVISES